MEGLRSKEAESGTAVNDETRGSYEMGNSGAWKNGMADLILELKKAEIKSEAIQVHMHQGHIETQQLKDNNETPTVMVHEGYIKKTTTLPLPNEEEWRQATSEDHDLGCIKRVLYSPEETPIDPK